MSSIREAGGGYYESPGYPDSIASRRKLPHPLRSLVSLAVRNDFLSFYDFSLGGSTIRKNRAYVGGVGAGEFTNFKAPFAFTADDPTGWTIAGGEDATREVTEVAQGELNADAPTPGGGYVNLWKNVATALPQMQQLPASWRPGHTYRIETILDTVGAGFLNLCENNGANIGAAINSLGLTSREFIATQVGAGIKPSSSSSNTDITISHLQANKISERDLAASGTIVNVAGPQGYKTGILGAERVLNGDFSAWTADNPDNWTVTGESGGDEVTERDSGQLHAGTNTVGGSVNLFEPAGNTLILRQSNRLQVGEYYRAVFVISANASAVTVLFGDGIGSAEVFVGAGQTGTFTIDFIANGADIVFNHSSGACDVTIDSISVKPFATKGAVFLDGATSDLHSKGPAQDGLTNMTLLMQVVGQFISGVSGLASKTLAEKSGEWKLEMNASHQLVFTRNRATTNATATTVNSWPNTDVAGFGRRKLEIAVAVDASGVINIWVNGVNQSLTAVSAGSGDFVSNTNAIYWGMNAAVSAGMIGNFGPAGLEDRVLSDQEIDTWFEILGS